MKRTVILLTVTLILALSIFSVSCSARTTERITTRSDIVASELGSVSEPSFLFKDYERMDLVLSPEEEAEAAANTEPDADEIKEDGINTRIASIWIIGISAVFLVGILIVIILLAKKNRS